MGNQAQQRREPELWQVVTPAKNDNRQIRQKRTARTVDSRAVNPVNVRQTRFAEPVRARQVRSAEPVRARQVRPTESVKVQNPRVARNTNAINTRAAGMPRTAGQIRAANSRTAGQIRRMNPKNRANVQALKRQKARRRQMWIYRCLAIMWVMALTATVIFLGKIFFENYHTEEKADNTFNPVWEDISVIIGDKDEKKPEIQEDFLTISEYNRPGTKLACVNNIFVHYTANPKTSAAQNRSYFENLGVTHERAASAHFIIGYEGEIIQCIPLEEEAYAVVERNADSISIECCFIEEDGSFTQETYNSLISMLAWLTDKYNLTAKDILRHYDCGGKLCPIYYVEHEDAWERLLYDVEHYKF